MLLQLATRRRAEVESAFPCDRLVSQRWPRRQPASSDLRVLLARYHRAILLSLAATSDTNDPAPLGPETKRSRSPSRAAPYSCRSCAVAAGFEPAEGANPHTLSRRAP